MRGYLFLSCLGHIAAAVYGNHFVEAACNLVTVRAVFGYGGSDLILLGDGEIFRFALEDPVVDMAGIGAGVPDRQAV